MYVTRKASHYKNFPEAITESPPEGPGSGILVIQDEEFEAEARCCFGMCRDRSLYHLPFPQNRRLSLSGVSAHLECFFIPVLGKSLSLNQYYVILGDGNNRGKVSTCSKEEDKVTSGCLSNQVKDVKPTDFALDRNNIYQQIEVISKRKKGFFSAKSVVSDGFPEFNLRMGTWTLLAASVSVQNCQIGKALGITRSSNEPLVDTKHSISSPVVVGKWYCPFIFVKEEGVKVKKQMDRTMYYEMTLEQYWEEIYPSHTGTTTIDVKIRFENPRTLFHGDRETDQGTTTAVDGVTWFRPVLKPEGNGLGLSTVIVKRMKWEEERRGWVDSKWVEKRVGKRGHGCNKVKFFVLVERFVLKRRDGSVALTCEFRHTNKVRTNWEWDVYF